MKKIFATIVGFVCSVTLIAQEKMNDPNAEKREVKEFHSIRVSHAFDVFLTQSNEDAVAVSASEKEYSDHIVVEVENGVLKISFDKEKKFWKGFNGNKMKLKAYISFRNIHSLNLSGSCDGKIFGVVKAEKLNLDLSGASDLNGKIDVQDLVVDLSGASDMDLEGSAKQIKIDVSGASNFKGYDLVTDYCEAEASGASGVKVTVNKELSARASGASEIGYRGDGLIRNIKTSGASNISKRS